LDYIGWHYLLNAGAYDHEQEVLLNDGIRLEVATVTDIYDGSGSLKELTGDNV
jgi:hypothetical protein